MKRIGKASALWLVSGSVLLGLAAPAGAAPAPHGAGRGDRLERALDAVHEAGMPGIYATVKDGTSVWNGASGVADTRTLRPVRPGFKHRVGSITTTFTAVAVLQEVSRGRIELDAPIGRYLGTLVPADLGEQVTVRMLLNHTSGLGDYFAAAFPSLNQGSPKDLDDNRYRTYTPEELLRLGLAQPRVAKPGERWAYASTNYVLAGLVLEKATGQSAASHITRNVIRPAGLWRTYFPGSSPRIRGPHSKAYESFFGMIDPAKDYSTYNMSVAWTSGELISTTGDVARFFRKLFAGRLIPAAQLAEMKRTVPVLDPQGNQVGEYGLGITVTDLGRCGRFWGHGGTAFGMATESLISEDSRRQLVYGVNATNYQRFDENGGLKPHPIDKARAQLVQDSLCQNSTASSTRYRVNLQGLVP
ncbi:serine hydrolase domain-containing protein [Streptomyces apocyni]|uniref:serine hydrolase domain-containing protein n=1 Tax=Streptomyces apocyni TaxID=2654677 RepID=UPI0018D09BCA|nr:serine hydrolase domain-containing protein [Streptomyces apocyni]